MSELGRGLALAQGTYWGATGVWPIVHMRSFEAVTGRKRSRWLVKTMGALITAVGGTLLFAGARRRVTPEVMFLGASSALALGVSGGWYAVRGRIRWVYLADAIVEALVAAGWAEAARQREEVARPEPVRLPAASGTRTIPVAPDEAVPEL